MTHLACTSIAGRPHRALLDYLEYWLPRAVALIPCAPPAISVALLGDKRMAALHETFLKTAGTTDVLTFELDYDERGRLTSGEVVLCVPFARREAKRRRHSPEHELLLYALHGVLHLSGYDDRTPAAHARMHEEEDRILEELGIGPVFRRRAREA